MKTTITITIALLSLISCSQTKKEAGPIKYKFINADTNAPIYGHRGLLKAMQEKKAWRLDMETGECVPYYTQNYIKK